MSVLTIAHLSDPHFGTVEEKVYSALLASLRGLGPDLVLVSGDITQRARRRQFEAARRFKEALAPTPFFAVPGNHDIPLFNLVGRMFRPYFGYHRYFLPQREKDIRLGSVRVIGLNSTSRWRHVQGKLDIERVRKTFFDGWDDSQVRVAMVHHPIDCAKTIDDKNRIRGREEVTNLFQEAKIDLVLSGHVHDPFVAIEKGMILCVAGTCLSWRTRLGAPNTFNLIKVETSPQRVEIQRFDIDPAFRFQPRADWVKRFTRSSTEWMEEGATPFSAV